MPPSVFPPEILRLYRREREVAELVYVRRQATAKQVQAELSDPLSSPAVRSMLNRLVGKGILTRHRCEGNTEYTYEPAISYVSSRERAVRQLADDYFDGSLAEVAASILRLSREPGQGEFGQQSLGAGS
jgi:predicted transcriptional regulator